ncbi:Nucleoporin nup84 [Paramarasmius palmivorus]|uniref:Nuclear pore complex protein n=1 Tax=Paramarasmius palmivorus TaxID=297713 RepID=A0AAW0E5C6_9AGAR
MADSDALYSSYAEVLHLAQTMKDDLEGLLDPETGVAPRMRQLCHDQISELEDSNTGEVLPEEIDLMKLEENTWALLQAVMPLRKTEQSITDTPQELLSQNPFTPTSTIAQAIMNSSPVLTELIVVREWLQETAPTPAHPEATTGYWKFTRHTVMQAMRTGASGRDGLVKELDPDAVNRDDGRGLAADDAGYEKSLAQALYGFIRAGRLEDAVNLCRSAHQPWRAASIRGSLLFRWKALSSEHNEEEDDDSELWSGNKRRKLWKSTCTRTALNPSLADHERVLYAALAPSPQTSLILKSACRTWEDHLWATISVLCDEKETMELARLGGSFWEGGGGAEGLKNVDKGVRTVSRDVIENEEEEWEKEVVGTLEGLKSATVEDGPPADHPFHFSQLNIILDRTGYLLEVFAEGLVNGAYDPSSYEYGPMCRFFAHLCLYLKMIDTSVPPNASSIILEAYLQVLEGAGQRNLIAMYAGALGENAIQRYALFLVSLELSADVNERRLTLTRAKEHGLDMDSVAAATAEMTINKAMEMLPVLKGPLPSIISTQSPPSDAELFLLRSIEWIIFSEATYDKALEQANHILRYFLASGRIQLARELLSMLPPELASITTDDLEVQATEYLHYRQFFTIWETLERVVECQALEAPNMSRDTKQAWLEDYKAFLSSFGARPLITFAADARQPGERANHKAIDLRVAGNGRRNGWKELIRIRQIYVPELIIRLHFILFNSRHKFPENLKMALKLANTIADSRYKLYEDFVNENGKRLGDYLGAVRQAILGGLEGGGSDPFRVLVL